MKVTWDSGRDCSTQGKDGGPCIVLLGEFFGAAHTSCNHVWLE